MAEKDTAPIMQRAQVMCTLCLDDFVEPRRLPCNDTHIFCTKCLHHYILEHSEEGNFECPASNPDCNIKHKLPEKGITGIRYYFQFADDIVPSNLNKCILCNDEHTEPRVLPCDEAHTFCTKCLHHHIRRHSQEGQFKCPRCKSMHQVPGSGLAGIRSQFPSPMTNKVEKEYSGTENKPYRPLCNEKGHGANEVIKFCETHKKMICLMCLTGDHEDCKQCHFHEEATRRKEEITDLLVDITNYSKELKRHIQDTKKAFDLTDPESDIKFMRKNVEDSFQRVLTLLNDMKNKLLQQITNIEKMICKKLAIESQQQLNQRVEEVGCDCNHLIAETDNCRIIKNACVIKEKWDKTQQTSISTYFWNFSSDELEKSCDEWLGSVALQQKYARDKEFALSTNTDVCNIIEAENNVIVACDNMHDLHVFMGTFACYEQRTKICISGNKSVQEIACLNRKSNGDLGMVIVDPNYKLHFISLVKDEPYYGSYYESYERQVVLRYRPSGISLYEKGDTCELIVADPDNRRICVCDTTGVETQVINLPYVQNLRYLIKTDVGFVYSDTYNSKVIWTDMKGTVLRTYAGHESHVLSGPRQLCVDQNSRNILICNTLKDNIHELDDQGNFVRVVDLAAYGLQRPTSIQYFQAGKLFLGATPVSDSNRRVVKVVQYPPSRCNITTETHSVKFTSCKWN